MKFLLANHGRHVQYIYVCLVLAVDSMHQHDIFDSEFSEELADIIFLLARLLLFRRFP